MFEELIKQIKECHYCEKKFGFVPRPVVWGKKNSKIVQISQAPSNNVSKTLKPFTDMSGKTLKYEWYQINDKEFYDENNFYIGALAHCYPGKDKNGNDKLPPKCCFKMWVEKEIKAVDNEIYVLIGAKAAKTFFPEEDFVDLVFKDNYWNGKLTLVLPHPSPLNKRWLKEHPMFMEQRIYEIRKIVHDIINN